MSKLTWQVSSAVLLVLGSVAPAFGGTIVVSSLLPCGIISGAPSVTDTPNGFTVTGNLKVNVPAGTSGCSLGWTAEKPIVVVDGTSGRAFLNYQVQIDLPTDLGTPYGSDLFWLVATSHLVGATGLIADSFAASVGSSHITGTGNVLADQVQSKLFFDVGAPVRLEQLFELDFSTPSLDTAATIGFNFSVTSESISPEPATGVLLFAGLAAVAVRSRRRR